jgi:glycosyltransferase involved in cell wall biosynthesis
VRILLFSNLFPTPREPARGTFTGHIVDHLATLADVTVVVPLPWIPSSSVVAALLPRQSKAFAGLPARADRGSVPVYFARYPLVPRLSERAHAFCMRLGAGPLIRRLHRERPFDVINAHWLYPDGAAAVKIGARLGLPVVLTALGSDINRMLPDPVHSAQIRAALQGARAITVVSRDLKSRLVATGVPQAKVAVVPNGVDTQLFRPLDRGAARDRLGIARDARVMVCVARLSREKGLHVAIEAMPRLLQAMPGALLALVGDGIEREALAARSRELGCDRQVRFVGAVPPGAVPEWLGAADVVALPSLSEGHPNAVMEALAAGRPVVASRVGAVAEYVSPAVGRVVEPGDPQALGEALLEALRQSWDSDAISHSVAGHTWAACARAYLAVLEGVSSEL